MPITSHNTLNDHTLLDLASNKVSRFNNDGGLLELVERRRGLKDPLKGFNTLGSDNVISRRLMLLGELPVTGGEGARLGGCGWGG